MWILESLFILVKGGVGIGNFLYHRLEDWKTYRNGSPEDRVNIATHYFVVFLLMGVLVWCFVYLDNQK